MRNVSGRNCSENQNTFYIQYFFPTVLRTIDQITWKNLSQPDRPQITSNTTQGRSDLHAW